MNQARRGLTSVREISLDLDELSVRIRKIQGKSDGTDHLDPRVSPLRARDLAGLPRAIVAVAGFDPLRDDGLAYAAALTANGVPVEVIHERDLVHGYIAFTAISPSSRTATRRLVRAIAATLTSTPERSST